MAFRDESTFCTFSLPSLYSFCASIMMSVLSPVDAVEGLIPRMSLKEVAEAMSVGIVSTTVKVLENKTGETNVYIRGLLPETTDEMLHMWGMRFGDIQSSKSIIDLKTGLCKG